MSVLVAQTGPIGANNGAIKLEESQTMNNPFADLDSLTDLLQIQPSDFKLDLDMDSIATDLESYERSAGTNDDGGAMSHFGFTCVNPDVTDMFSDIAVSNDWSAF